MKRKLRFCLIKQENTNHDGKEGVIYTYLCVKFILFFKSNDWLDKLIIKFIYCLIIMQKILFYCL